MPPEADTAYQKCSNCFVTLDASEMEPFSEIICPRCNATVRVRSRFNNFELTEVIAHGGMGTVYKARDLNLNRIVALKLLRREFSADQEYIRKLETEAQITAQVNHPHVVKVYSFGGDHGQFYIAMELMEKGSLDDLMVSQGRIPEMQMLEVGIQAARGLRAAFHAGLIHRDIKPGNILFADEHIAKLVDFGLALPLAQAQEAEAELWGTPYYVSPEKLNNEPEDFRSDIYCLGGTLFHAMAGRPPFPAETASVAVLKELKSNPVSLQAVAPDISSPTAYVINLKVRSAPSTLRFFSLCSFSQGGPCFSRTRSSANGPPFRRCNVRTPRPMEMPKPTMPHPDRKRRSFPTISSTRRAGSCSMAICRAL